MTALAELAGFAGVTTAPISALEASWNVVGSTIRAAVEGATADAISRLNLTLRQNAITGAPRARPIGSAGRASIRTAALLTAAAAATTARSPGIAVTAAALAAGDADASTVADLVIAVSIGLEVTTRLGTIFSLPQFDGHGWSVVGVVEPIGSAVAVARLLGLNCVASGNAIGLAATQSAGLRTADAYDTGPLQVGMAAWIGTDAALLAGRGFTGPAIAFSPPVLKGRGLDYESTVATALGEDLGASWTHTPGTATAAVPHPAGALNDWLDRPVRQLIDAVLTEQPKQHREQESVQPPTQRAPRSSQ